ncbi:MAG: FAD-dependent oxidoreductase [Anaerolineales bacterium]
MAPCRDACPSGQRAQGYIALIREGRWDDALRVIKMDNPFPGICGRICNHRCENACNRGKLDEPINIRALKRFVTDKVYANSRQPVEPVEIKHPKTRVAIIGAGPCGLTAAQDIIREGYPVTIFEAMPVAGGMLRLGVPEYRLPTEIIEREVQDIVDLGVNLQLNHQVENLDDIFIEGYESVLIAVGAHEGIRLPIPGANLDGVIINTHFLRDVRLGRYETDPSEQVMTPDGRPFGPKVLVLGGGNVAIDCARSAVRLGSEVHLACLESREEMPAHAWEVDAAEQEGVHLYPGRTFEQIRSNGNGRILGVECMLVESFHFDEGGRLHLEKVPGSQHEISCDTVIFSVGQRAGLAFIPEDAGVGLTEQQTIAINPNTYATSRPGVFAAGDSVSGTAFVIEAVANGHQAAESILRYLQGKPLEPHPKPDLPVVNLTKREIEDRLMRGEVHKQPRVPMRELPLEQRVQNFAEVEAGYDDDSAQAEAARCLACGICSECWSCVFACGRDAIVHDDIERTEKVDVGAVILAPGYQVYNAHLSEEFGLGRYPNVVTGLQFERLLSASGPTMGHIQRPSDGEIPQRIAFLQCIGSRDQSHDYCSAVCCMYATKEAIMAKEHHPDLDIHVFMMDMRAFSKGYEEYYHRAEKKYGVRYERCRISALQEDPNTHNLIIQHPGENGHSSPQIDEFDLVVLSVGMEISESVRALGRRLGIELDEYGFCHTVQFNPIETSRSGIYAAGPFREPKDIPESVVEASSAAAAAASRLKDSRFTLTTVTEYPPELDLTGQEPRVGVFVCHCGSNIGGYLDVPMVKEYASGLPNVVHAEDNLYTCSQDSIRHITDVVKEKDLNRVVVASCTPLTHQPLFQDSLRAAGLNPYLFEMANIRNQCSWVHSDNWDKATAKAKDLVRMAVARASLLEAQTTIDVPVKSAALVIGGGAAGMTSALSLAEQNYEVHLIEKEAELGGKLRQVYTGINGWDTYPDKDDLQKTFSRDDPQEVLRQLIDQVQESENIHLHLESRVIGSDGFKGNFTTTIEHADGRREQLAHGATILATGAQEYRGPEYGYGSDSRIVSQLQLEGLLQDWRDRKNSKWEHESTIGPSDGIENNRLSDYPSSVVMIQCVGPGETFCSRTCCTVALKNALALKALKPATHITILYRDIRTYGFKERLYTQARERGILFVRYDPSNKPKVAVKNLEDQAKRGVSESFPSTTKQESALQVTVHDSQLNRELVLNPELLVLSMPMVPNPDVGELAKIFKVSIDSDGFFLEAHVKLRPVDFATDGIFMAGLAHYPKLLDEAIIQAQAAAARAARILSQDTLTAGGRVAVVDASKCTGCLTCVRVCPFGVPQIEANLLGIGDILGAANIEAAICQGCGSCAAECPAQAIQLMHYTDAQMMAKVDALIAPSSGFVPLSSLEVTQA